MSISIGLSRLSRALAVGNPVFSANLSKHRRRKGKFYTLDLMLYHRARRNYIEAFAKKIFVVDTAVPELGVSPLNSSIVPLKQKESLLDNLHDFSFERAPANEKVSESEFWNHVLDAGHLVYQGCRFGQCLVCPYAENSGKCLITMARKHLNI